MVDAKVYTPLEALFLCQWIQNHGPEAFEATVFPRISHELINNHFLQANASYDASRLTPGALQEFFLQLFRDELKDDAARVEASGTSPQPNTRKRKLGPPLVQSLKEARLYIDKLPAFVERLYLIYREDLIREIEREEREYEETQAEIEKLKLSASNHQADSRPDQQRATVISSSSTAGSAVVSPVHQPSQLRSQASSLQPSPVQPARQLNPHLPSRGYPNLSPGSGEAIQAKVGQQSGLQPPAGAAPSSLYVPPPAPMRQPAPSGPAKAATPIQAKLPSTLEWQTPYQPQRAQTRPPNITLPVAGSSTQDMVWRGSTPVSASQPGSTTTRPIGPSSTQPSPAFPRPQTLVAQASQTVLASALRSPSSLQVAGAGLPAATQARSAATTPGHSIGPSTPVANDLQNAAIISAQVTASLNATPGQASLGRSSYFPQTPLTGQPAPKSIGTRWKSGVQTPSTPRPDSIIMPSPKVEPLSPIKKHAALPDPKADSAAQESSEVVEDAEQQSEAIEEEEDDESVDVDAQIKDEIERPYSAAASSQDPLQEAGDDLPRILAGAKRKRQDSDAKPLVQKASVPTHVLWTRGFSKISNSALDHIAAHRNANMFAKALTDSDAPGYNSIVYDQVHLKSIRAAIKEGHKHAVIAANALPDGDPGGGAVWLPLSEKLIPPSAIINSGQLKRELFRMCANAIMYNPDPKRGVGPSFLRDEDAGEGAHGDEEGGSADTMTRGYKVDENSVVNGALAMLDEAEMILDNLRATEAQPDLPPPSGSSSMTMAVPMATRGQSRSRQGTETEQDTEGETVGLSRTDSKRQRTARV